MTPASGTLYLVATPIGNLADLGLRALEVLKSVDCIACEDTRHSRGLCARYGISTPLFSHYREKERERAAKLLTMLQEGKNIAVISDAGTPALSDPGSVLVRLARAAGITVRSIPGPSALTTALALAGLEESRFYFGGFLPPTRHARLQALRGLAILPCPLIFYEAPHRIAACIADMLEAFGDRPAQLFRELTKLHEEHLTGALSELGRRAAAGMKGELVLLVAGRETAPPGPDELAALLRRLRDGGSSLRDAVAEAAGTLGLPRGEAYRAALPIWEEQRENDHQPSPSATP